MTPTLTFDQLPEAVTTLLNEVSLVKSLLLKQQVITPATDETNQFLTIQEASQFLMLSIPTIYSKVSRKELPHYKRGKRLYFRKTDLIDFLKSGRVLTADEAQAQAQAQADEFLSKKVRG